MSLSQIALNNIGHLRRMKNRLNGDIMHWNDVRPDDEKEEYNIIKIKEEVVHLISIIYYTL